MIGMNAKTGQSLSGLAHLKQSIEDILTTPKGSRVMRRDYGCALFELVDKPYSSVLVGDITMEISQALALWEPRFALERVVVNRIGSGKLSIEVIGKYLLNGEAVHLEGIVF